MKKIFFGFAIFFAFLTQGWGDTEPNNSCAQAEVWSTLANYGDSSTTLSGSVSSGNDDYYKLVIQQGGVLDVTLQANNSSNFYLLNSSCVGVASKTGTKSATISYSGNTGTYYLRINRNGNATYSSVKATLSFPSENLKDFELIYTKNISGSVKAIGNSVLCKSSKQESWNYTTGTCVQPGDSEPNNNFYAIYSDIDGDSSTTDSTSAKLTIPTGARIVWAGLYWNGRLGSGKTTAEKLAAKTIKLKLPGASSYTAVTADALNWATSAFAYKGYKNITDIINKTSPNGDYFVSGIKTELEKNAFGAWSLFVVYEKDGETFKNISLYDGFFSMSSAASGDLGGVKTKNVDISGFLTPTSGAVNSKLLIFSAEGDMDYASETLSMTNKSGSEVTISNSLNPANNAFNSNITENGAAFTDRNPSYTNTIGIDIDTFDVSSIMQNGQKTTTIKFATSLEQYFPSAMAFSTDLYIPDVCYEEDITKNGQPISGVFVGDILDVNVTITNKNAETAKKVVITKTFNEYLGYKVGTTSIKPSGAPSFIPVTDEQGDDTVSYDNGLQKLTLNMGPDATSAVGGSILQNQMEEFQNKITLLKDGDFTSDYKVSFTDILGLTDYADIPIMKCSKLPATSLSVSPTGNVRVVESGKNWSDNNDGRLLMKVASNVPYSYDILFALNDSGTTLTSGKIKKLELISRVNNSVIATLIDTLTTVNQRSSFNIVLNKAYKDLQFRVTLESGALATSNNFSVRPASFDLGIASVVSAGAIVTPLYAKSKESFITSDYNGRAVVTTTLDIAGRINCSSGANDTNITSPVDFTAGIYGNSTTGAFTNVGVYSLRLLDSTWTSADQTLDDCTVNSASNTADAAGKFGCNIDTEKTFTVSPASFVLNNISIAQSGNNFTYYLKEDATELPKMNASVGGGTVSAVGLNSSLPLSNYTSGCYANPYTLHITAPSMSGLTLVANDYTSNTDFTNGVLTFSSSISPMYNYYTPDTKLIFEPMTQVGGVDINVSISENIIGGLSATTTTTNFASSNKVNFLYGKVSMPNAMVDYNSTGTNIKAFTQVYATSSASLPNLPSGSWAQALGSTNWWINSLDSSSSLSHVYVRKSDALTALSNEVGTITSPATIVTGIATMNLQPTNTDQKLKIHLDVPSYLWYSSAGVAYDFTAGSDCSKHPCASVDIFGVADKAWYGTGDKKGDKAINTVPKGKRAPKVNW